MIIILSRNACLVPRRIAPSNNFNGNLLTVVCDSVLGEALALHGLAHKVDYKLPREKLLSGDTLHFGMISQLRSIGSQRLN